MSPRATMDHRTMCRALAERILVNSLRFSIADASESAGNAATAYDDPMSASGTATRLPASVKTDTDPVPILEAMAVKASTVIEFMPSARERGMESRTIGSMSDSFGIRIFGMRPASMSTGILTAK